jgi:hypothetical protein
MVKKVPEVRGVHWVERKKAYQVYHKRKYIGLYTDRDAAIAAKARAAGVAKSELLKDRTKTHLNRLPKGITKRRNSFQVQDSRTGKYIGVAKTVKAATAMLPKESSSCGNRLFLARGSDLMEHFKTWIDIFTDSNGEIGEATRCGLQLTAGPA